MCYNEYIKGKENPPNQKGIDTMADKKMTYADALTTIEQYFQTANIEEYPPKLADAINRMGELKASIEKRNSKKADAPKKPTKTQQENAALAVKVKDFLYEQDEAMPCKAIAEQFGVSPQKMSAILKLIPSISKESVKGVTMFSVQ